MAQLWKLERGPGSRTKLTRTTIAPARAEAKATTPPSPPAADSGNGGGEFDPLSIKGVGEETAQLLAEGGYDTEEKLRAAAIADLQTLGIGPRSIAGIQKWQEGE